MDKFSDVLVEVGLEYNVAYGIWIMSVEKNKEHFKQWVQDYPYTEMFSRKGRCSMKVTDSEDVGTRMDVTMHRTYV